MTDLATPSAVSVRAPEGPPSRPSLAARIPPDGTSDPDEILSLFIEWVSEIGL